MTHEHPRSRAISRHCSAVTALACALLFATAPANAKPAPVTLAADGEARAVIVIGKEPSPVVRFAANELADKLERMTGATFQTVPQLPTTGAAIVLGDQPAARAAGIDVDALPRDGYIIRTTPKRLFIAGRDDPTDKAKRLFELTEKTAVADRSRNALRQQYSPVRWDFERATLFGVYDFLETLGARWFFPGPDGEVLPERSDVIVQPIDRRETPAFEMRSIGLQYYRKNQVYNKPGEYRALDWTAEADILFTMRQRHSTRWLAFNHRPSRHDWEPRFGHSHPEYFALLPTGKRDLTALHEDGSHRGHLCYTHPGMLGQTIADVRAYFRGESASSRGMNTKNPDDMASNNGWNVRTTYGNTFSLLPQDGFAACQHTACRGRVREDRTYSGAWHSDLVWPFVDRVARTVQDEFPDKRLTCLAYASYTAPPSNLKRLPENVIVGFVPRLAGRFYTYVDPDTFDRYASLMREWNGITAGPLLVWLNDMYRTKRPSRRGVPMTLPSQQAKFARLWRDEGARWVYIVLERHAPYMTHLRRYLWYRLLWDPEVDVQSLIDDYVAKLYGPASSPMGRLITDLLARSRAIAEADAGQIEVWSDHFTADVLARYTRWHEQAMRAAGQTSYARAVTQFNQHYLERLRRGRGWYERNIAAVVDSEEAKLTARRAWEPITVDGKLEEDDWNLSDRAAPFHSNTSDKPTTWRTEARMLYTEDMLYFAFVCHDPAAQQRTPTNGDDTVEVFLDPTHHHDSYYQIMVDTAGRIVADNYRQVVGEPIDTGWDSGAEAAVHRESDRWVVELAVPRDRLEGGRVTPGSKRAREADRPWGVNFCRTISDAPRKADRFSCFSPLLRGGFHQPDLFAHMYFD